MSNAFTWLMGYVTGAAMMFLSLGAMGRIKWPPVKGQK